MKFVIIFLAALPITVSAPNVGIGTSSPNGGLHVISNSGIVAKGTINSGEIINETGPGSLFIFNPRKGAIRAGYLSEVGPTYWDNASTGFFSIGLGYDAKAISESSVAIGSSVSANTYGSMAIGRKINAGYPFFGSGESTFAIGNGDNAGFTSGGHYATGNRGFAIGNNCQSVGNRAFAIGNDCVAGKFLDDDQAGRWSFALGNSCVSSGLYSFAFGNNANTNERQGAMVLGSRVDGVSVLSPADFHFLAQFAGGYQLQSNSAGTLGVYLNPNATMWASLCDSTKKEDGLAMNDDEILEKLATINYSSWKYKDDPDVTNRHYGIMAQDFYAAFGTDGLGKIGNDSLVNPIDLLGVAYSAIKALEKRTDEIEGLKSENEDLKARLEKLELLVIGNSRNN